MINPKQAYKKWLIDEIKTNSKLSYPEIIKEVYVFSKTVEFQKSYKAWLNKIFIKKKVVGPKHIGEIFKKLLGK